VDVKLSFKLSDGPGCGAPRLTEKKFELEANSIDKSLPAIDAPGLGISSLGLRPEVLKLSLFEHKRAAARGMVAPADLDCGRLMEEQFSYTGEGEVFARTVFAKAASIIYFPVWLVETVSRAGDGGFCVVDGLSEDVWSTSAPVEIIDRLLAPVKGYEAAGLRPLKCPECGAALPVRPKDVVFFCKECSKAWYITGSDFTEVPFRVAGPVLKSPPPSDLLPFWVVRVRMRAGDRLLDNKRDLVEIAPGSSIPKESDREIPLRFFVPAFEIGNLRALSRIAQGFTRQQPVFQPSDLGDACLPVSGCVISPDDALTLAPLILFSLIPKGNKKALKFALDAQVEPVSAELVYIPFSRGRFELTDCLCGLSIPAAAVRE
jgi:hypothetical protein